MALTIQFDAQMKLQSTTEQEFITNKIHALEIAGEWIPGIKIIQRTDPFQNLFICKNGLKLYGLTRASFKYLPAREYRGIIFDPDSPRTCQLGVTKCKATSIVEKKIYISYDQLMEKGKADLVIVHYLFPGEPTRSHFTFTQIILLNFESWATTKAKRILEEMVFKRRNAAKFSHLTGRNKEVLSLMTKGLKAKQIGERLFIGVNTVNSHKKRIKELLETSDNWEILRYCLAFDLL